MKAVQLHIKLLFLIAFFKYVTCVTDPIIVNWIKATGKSYKNIVSNVNKIQYSANYVYISSSGIPSYSIGPWSNNPNDAGDQKFTFKFPRNPTVPNSKTSTPLGNIGVWLNGLSIYNAYDGMTYNNGGVWYRNAYYFEGSSFDSCNGHPDSSSNYHHHISPTCMYTISSTSHSPLIGYAFDGYPIYGPFGYSNPMSSSSSIKRILSSYRKRSITDRTTLADGTTLTSSQYGPSLTAYPLGAFLQDFEYASGLGDLDAYNGRTCVTPEYPGGTYAYFLTTDSTGTPSYPYVIGPSFYGSPESSNLGPSSGKSTPTESVTTYFSYSSTTRIKSAYLSIIVMLLPFWCLFF